MSRVGKVRGFGTRRPQFQHARQLREPVDDLPRA